MANEILATKFYFPPLQLKAVPRPRLFEQLNEGLQRKVVLVSAPAGYGKTTLISEWVASCHQKVAWLSLDKNDNEPKRFLTYFIAALQTVVPRIGAETAIGLQTPQPPAIEALLTILLNEIANIPDSIIVVLDDYHLMDGEAVENALTFMVENLPPQLHLVITTREDPRLPLARLRARGQLTELRAADLRFTASETAEYLNRVMGLNLSFEDIAALGARTEGWIAGLQMAALSLQQREERNAGKFIEDFNGSHRYIMDFLVDEVFLCQPAEVQTFLLYTSILDQLCSSLCESILPVGGQESTRSIGVVEVKNAQEILTYLEHANLFITPLDDHRQWYRYHHLFSDLLRYRLGQTYPEMVATLHLRASQWYEQAGLTGPAVQHALAAKAYNHAATLVEQFAPTIIQESEISTLLRWMASLPEDEVQARPLLSLYRVWGLFLNGKIKQAALNLETIEGSLATDEDKRTPEVQAHIAAMRANLLRQSGDFTQAIALSQQALTIIPEQSTLLRARIKLNLSFAYYLEGKFEPAYQQLTEIIAADQTDQQMLNTLSAFYIKTQLLLAQGSLGRALENCQDGLRLAAQHGWSNLPAAGFLYVAYGGLLRERNELTTAVEYLQRGIEQGQAGGIPHISIIGYIWLAWLRQTQGDSEGSQEAVRSASLLVQEFQMSRFWPIPPAACWQARLWIARGDLAPASRWAQDYGLNESNRPLTYLNEVEHLTLVRLLIRQDHLDAAENLLLQLHQAAASAGRYGSLIEILILQAITFDAQNRGEKALSTLVQAFDLAESEGFVRLFLDEGHPMTALLRRAIAHNLHAPYALRLLNSMDETTAAQQTFSEFLSTRELDVLRRIAAGYSNLEIAQDLVLAVSTVKKHVNNIYGKLNVSSRTQAVARARELGLL